VDWLSLEDEGGVGPTSVDELVVCSAVVGDVGMEVGLEPYAVVVDEGVVVVGEGVVVVREGVVVIGEGVAVGGYEVIEDGSCEVVDSTVVGVAT